MILEFSCSNHKSIKEEIKFSMTAGSDNTLEDSLKEFNETKILRSAVVYGGNGSGKSNFLSALAFMHELVANSMNHQPGQGIYQAPHKLSASNIPSKYAIQFVKDDIRYAYGFSIKNNEVSDEYLYYFPKGRQVKIFEREYMLISQGHKYKTSFELVYDVLKPNRLFLSCAANYSKLGEVEKAFLFFKDDIVMYNSLINNWKEYSINAMQNDPIIKEQFLKILKELVPDVEGIDVKLQKININDLPKEAQIPEPLRALLNTQEANQMEARIRYKHFTTDVMTEESDGIKKLFEVICPILDIIKNGKILLCDELENSLHESIIYEIVNLFNNSQKDKFAQFIFSTHDTGLLNVNLFRRDQIWFTELNAQRATNLYSLAEIKNVRKTENLEKGYLSGKYGAIPMINKEFFQMFAKEVI